MVLGAIVGFIVGPSIAVIAPVGTVFIRLLRMTILPLIFFSVTSGVASIADLESAEKSRGPSSPATGPFLRFWLQLPVWSGR